MKAIISIPYEICQQAAAAQAFMSNQKYLAHIDELQYLGENNFGFHSFKNTGHMDFPYYIDLDGNRLEFHKKSDLLDGVALYAVSVKSFTKSPKLLAGVQKIWDKYPWLKKPSRHPGLEIIKIEGFD